MRRTHMLALAVAGVAGGCAAVAYAHSGATGVVAERMTGMMMLGDQMQTLTPIINGNASPDAAAIGEAASMIAAHSGEAMTGLFPAGSTDSPSEARPEIWENWALFTRYAQQLQDLAQELAAIDDESVPAPAPERSADNEWESMDTAVLLGLAPRSKSGTSVSSQSRESTAAPRSGAAIVSDIAATCSSCHAAFRK